MYSELFSFSHVSIFIHKVDNLYGISFKMSDLKNKSPNSLGLGFKSFAQHI